MGMAGSSLPKLDKDVDQLSIPTRQLLDAETVRAADAIAATVALIQRAFRGKPELGKMTVGLMAENPRFAEAGVYFDETASTGAAIVLHCLPVAEEVRVSFQPMSSFARKLQWMSLVFGLIAGVGLAFGGAKVLGFQLAVALVVGLLLGVVLAVLLIVASKRLVRPNARSVEMTRQLAEGFRAFIDKGDFSPNRSSGKTV